VHTLFIFIFLVRFPKTMKSFETFYEATKNIDEPCVWVIVYVTPNFLSSGTIDMKNHKRENREQMKEISMRNS
jgi:hypothetical protein